MLGLHRDSIVNLTALSHHSFDDDDNKQADDKSIASSDNNKTEEEDNFIGLKIDDNEQDNDEAKIYNELNNLAIINAAKQDMSSKALSSKDSSSSGYSDNNEGYYDDYDNDEYYDSYDNYANGSVVWFENKDGNTSKRQTNKPFECFFPCFPFMGQQKGSKHHHHHDTNKDDSEHTNNSSSEQDHGVIYDQSLNTIPSNVSDDERYGKPLTEKQHQAVLARLNLPENVRSASMPPHHALHNSLKHKTPDDGAGPTLPKPKTVRKGILKHPTPPPEPGHGRSISMGALSQKKAKQKQRRSLFPTSSKTYKPTEKKNIKFISLAKVCTVPSLSSMSFVTRSNVWWQKGEYDDFKKAARIITKALLTGGSEIWLSETSKDKAVVDNTFGSKWWCKFGHSRRGLEHLCNITEGRNRQKNVMQATKAVVDEYRRQKVVGHFDDKRLASVSSQYTSWARDLARATALADQEAVNKNFHLTNSKDRNHYVLQTLKQHQQHSYDMPDCTINVGDIVGINLPEQQVFTQQKQINNNNGATHDPHMLDAHTHSSMVYRKHQLKHLKNNKNDSLSQHSSDSSLKKKAAGYGVGNGQRTDKIRNNLPVLPTPKYAGVV